MRPVPAFLLSPIPAVGLVLFFNISSRVFAYNPLLFLATSFVTQLLPQLVFAAPARWYLARRGFRSLWIDAGLGVAAALLVATVFLLLAPNRLPDALLIRAIAIAALLGGLSGLSYGLLRFRDRKASAASTPADLAARFD